MKSNIILAGAPRAGKTTLARRVARELGYQHVSMDAINAAFERVFPEVGIDTYAHLPSLEILYNISGKIAPFIRAMTDCGDYDEAGRGIVLDVYQLLPEDYDRHFAGSSCEVYYLLTSDVTPEERFAIQKAHDTPADYTYDRPDAELREGCGYIVEQSRIMRAQCERLGLPFFETARERERVLDGLLRELTEKHGG